MITMDIPAENPLPVSAVNAYKHFLTQTSRPYHRTRNNHCYCHHYCLIEPCHNSWHCLWDLHLTKVCHFVEPNALAASTTSLST